MKYLKFSIFFLSLIFLLTACSAIKKLDKSDEYKNTSSAHDKPLVLPKDIDNGVIETHYSVPKAEGKIPAGSLILPPGSNLTEK